MKLSAPEIPEGWLGLDLDVPARAEVVDVLQNVLQPVRVGESEGHETTSLGAKGQPVKECLAHIRWNLERHKHRQ
jgi:hypothetical protein